jgi:hypothetical protein
MSQLRCFKHFIMCLFYKEVATTLLFMLHNVFIYKDIATMLQKKNAE